MSYTNASIENQAVLNITDPSDGLISLVPINDELFITPGEDKKALYVTNNLDKPISYVLEYEHDYLSLHLPDGGFLYPGEISIIALSAADSCPTGDITLPIALQADFEGGSARIATDLAVCVESDDTQSKGILGDEKTYSEDGEDLDLSADSAITAKSNGGTTDGENADLSADSVEQGAEAGSYESGNEVSTEI